MRERYTYVKPRVAFAKDGFQDNKTGEIQDFTVDTVLDLLNDYNQFQEQVFKELDKRIMTLQKNSSYCHQSGSHEKGLEFTLQAELLERLKKEYITILNKLNGEGERYD